MPNRKQRTENCEPIPMSPQLTTALLAQIRTRARNARLSLSTRQPRRKRR